LVLKNRTAHARLIEGIGHGVRRPLDNRSLGGQVWLF